MLTRVSGPTRALGLTHVFDGRVYVRVCVCVFGLAWAGKDWVGWCWLGLGLTVWVAVDSVGSVRDWSGSFAMEEKRPWLGQGQAGASLNPAWLSNGKTSRTPLRTLLVHLAKRMPVT